MRYGCHPLGRSQMGKLVIEEEVRSELFQKWCFRQSSQEEGLVYVNPP